MDINQEIAKHLEWIEAVAAKIGTQNLTREEIQTLSQHDRCELGRWLGCDESDAYRDFSEFEQLEQSHKRFHNVAGDMISALEAGDDELAVEKEEIFVKASQEVIGLLHALQVHADEKQNSKEDQP